MTRTTSLKRIMLCALAIFILSAGTTLHAGILYTQPFDASGNLYASQNDTNSGGQGSFATAYDNFTLGANSTVTEVDFTGGYYNGTPASIARWTVTFYNNAAGVPGGSLAS